MPEIIKIKDLNENNPEILKRVSKFLVDGKIAVLPTNTIYGLSCCFDRPGSLQKIYEIKHRNKNMPFIVLISQIEMLFGLAEEINDNAIKIMKKYWNPKNPQSLTLIFNKKTSSSISHCMPHNKPDPVEISDRSSGKIPDRISDKISKTKLTIAVRISGIKFLSGLIDICGPIISTSANISGIDIKPVIVADIPKDITEKVDLVVEYQGILPGIESTIVDVSGRNPVLIRKGAVNFP